MRIQDWDKLNLDMINTINDNDVEDDIDSDYDFSDVDPFFLRFAKKIISW